MKLAKNNSLWEVSAKTSPPRQFRVDREKIGDYMIQQVQTHPIETDVYMTEEDKTLLKNFLSKRHQTLGDLLTINTVDGSSIMSSLEKLVSFGLVHRDWEKEEDLHIDVVYSLTAEGHYIVTQKIQK